MRKEIKLTLTKEQKKYLPALQWLYTGERASGRSTLIAYALIETVLRTGQSQRIIDHHPSTHSDMFLARTIEALLEENKLPLKVNRSTLMLVPKK
ncbi:hypothetical protein C4568_03630 [Candidatus Parcubacteria bacterium]|nr:MAG: hypothetical protein C4568_03630 [Candidatus Parcubacteria bacterium]